MRGIVLHGGYGTRLRPLTHTGPKQLIPIANKPMSQYVFEDLKEAGIVDIAVVLGNLYPEKVKEYYKDGKDFGVNMSYVYQGEPKGIAHAVGLCEEYVDGEPFVVYLGDNLLKGGMKQQVEEFKASSHDAMILLCKVKNPERFGVARFDEEGRLIQLMEKPKKPPSDYALTGIYFFKPVIFEMIKDLKPSWRGELEITEAIQMLIDRSYSVGHSFVSGWWKDTGTPEDILDANRLVLDEMDHRVFGIVEDDSSIQGRVSTSSESVVKKGALVRGPAIIGVKTTVESGVYIGPYTSVGNNVVVKRGEIENSIVMDNCLIDVNERIVDSLIASHSTVVSSKNNRPQGKRFILGDRSHLEL